MKRTFDAQAYYKTLSSIDKTKHAQTKAAEARAELEKKGLPPINRTTEWRAGKK